MTTQDGNSLDAKINALGMRVGNQVTDSSTGLPVTASTQTWLDTESRLAVGTQQPFAMGASQSTRTMALFTLSGIAQANVLTNTLVTGASVTTATKAGFVRVDVTSDDNTLTGGSYYLELFTLS